ncbi:polyprenyl synthetase family protein [Parachlamydia sp. AcF125]|uniref:polyprenyl synthetase family protein n=1 Tax=Parachlamydia sp. AcF125 TaxID=2795736 RepID=UPI001BCA55B5|nr:Farnesyl diphosphate synthase [Parachlamydia sp. AcF125]
MNPFSVLLSYQAEVEAKIEQSIPILGVKSQIRDACEYALRNGGKRFRPALVLMVARALGKQADVSEAALAVEFFHTASLIADDLPCMDNEDERRNKPSLHKVFGEDVALLASYALIAEGYRYLAQNSETLQLQRVSFANRCGHLCVLAIQNVAHNTGLFGATGGQFLDIHEPNLSLSALKDIMHKKTVSLFEISFVLGWLFGGGELEKLPLVKAAASHFGMAFQIADDLSDMQQDLKNGRKANMGLLIGVEEAARMFHKETHSFLAVLQQLDIQGQELEALIKTLIQKTEECLA